jgi:hypothetical protein
VKQHGGRDGAWGRPKLQGGELVAAYALGFKRESEMNERQSEWQRKKKNEGELARLGLQGRFERYFKTVQISQNSQNIFITVVLSLD